MSQKVVYQHTYVIPHSTGLAVVHVAAAVGLLLRALSQKINMTRDMLTIATISAIRNPVLQTVALQKFAG